MKRTVVLLVVLLQTTVLTAQNSAAVFENVRSVYSGDSAFATVAYVEQFWRIAGNRGFDSSIFHVVNKLKAAGYVEESTSIASDRLVYRIEKRPMQRPTWEPISASLTIVGDADPLLDFSTNRNMIATGSFPTKIVAELIDCGKGQNLESLDLEGKIAYFLGSPGRLAKKVFEKGAVGIIAYGLPDYLKPTKHVNSIQFRRMYGVEEYKKWGIVLSYSANKRLASALKKGLVEVDINIETKQYESEELTLVAEVKGSVNPQEQFVFSAHVQEPGANDNASGVGVQIEMARTAAQLLKSGKINPKRTIAFLWGDEIVSTRRYVKENVSDDKSIIWGMSLDMVGENTEVTGGSFLIEKMPDPSAIWTRGNDKHTEWGGKKMKESEMTPHYLNDYVINRFKEQGEYADWRVETNPYEGGSDHIPFLRAGIPAVLAWHFTDEFYHTDGDRLDKVSAETLQNVGISALTVALLLTDPSEELVASVVNEVLTQGKTRIDIESELSMVAIKKGESVESQTHILKIWGNWYRLAIQSIADIELQGPSEVTKLNIETAAATISAFTTSKIEDLTNN